jgi:hypothetical protein
MGWKQMLATMDPEEIGYQMAFDAIEAERMPHMASRLSSPPAKGGWIDLADPDIAYKLRQRAGMVT